LVASHVASGVVHALLWMFRASTVACMPMASASPEVAEDPGGGFQVSSGNGGACWLSGFVPPPDDVTPAVATVGGPAAVWLTPAALTLALCCEITLTLTLSLTTVALPLRPVLGPGAGGADPPCDEPEVLPDDPPPAWTAPLEAFAQPRLSTEVSKLMSMKIGA
jgi:hypothetical protein